MRCTSTKYESVRSIDRGCTRRTSLNILLFSLTIETSALRLKLLNIKMKSFLFLNINKLKINIKILSLNVFELIMITNIRILILIFIVLIMISREILFILKTSNKITSSNNLIKRFLTLLILLLKTLILIENIN